jgi:hypothetical protein
MRTLLLILAGGILVNACSRTSDEAAVKDLLAEARKQVAPDRRTAIFRVEGTLEGTTLTLRGTIHSPRHRDELFRYIREKTGYTIVDSLVPLPAPSVGERTMGIVSVSVANMRVKPAHAAELGTQALLGTPVRILERNDEGWFNIQTPDDYCGWTDDHIVRMTEREYDTWATTPKVIVTAGLAIVGTAKDPGADPVADVVLGNLLLLRKAGSPWTEVELPDGRRGFIPSADVEPFGRWLAEAKDTPERIVATAKRFLGLPYFWGGTSAKGLDCSGFTKTVYYLNGVVLPRDASQQERVGDPIPASEGVPELLRGDLLFFGRKASEGQAERVTHVAISLGGARFIHASNYVRTNSLDPADPEFAPDRAATYLRAKRIIGADERSGIRRLAQMPMYKPAEVQ